MHARKRVGRVIAWMAAGTATAALVGCGTPEPKVAVKHSTKEYFAESAYGVKASPRVAGLGDRVPRRTGRYQVGKPYQVKGNWYHPKLDAGYNKAGAASWYGSAFHGRLTANGEVYDMARLTAAHPTMPLPSYARVTNEDNGSSVIVRVNDRGPFEKGRIIDLSARAAELLDYRHTGVARVKVAYVGPAPLDAHDDQYLVASYRPGGAAPDPSDGLPTGVMIAMNGPTPSAPVGATDLAFANQPGLQQQAGSHLPSFGPIVPDRPVRAVPFEGEQAVAMLLSYADERVRDASAAFSSVMNPAMTAEDVAASWKRANAAAPQTVPAGQGYIALGTWQEREQALQEMQRLSGYGKPTMEVSGDGALYSLNLYPDGRYGLDAMLQAAWKAGAADAFAVRD